MCEADPLCAENIGLKDIARSRRGELISRGELIMYYRSWFLFIIVKRKPKQIDKKNSDFFKSSIKEHLFCRTSASDCF